MYVLGLTGGIASGKSTVSRMFQELGALVLDADIFARAVVMPAGAGFREVVALFGPQVVTAAGTLDRRHIADVVFADAQARSRLEDIIHPLVYKAMDDCLRQLRAAPGINMVVLSIPLLYEKPLAVPWCDSVAVVWTPEPVQLARLIARDSLLEKDARLRIKAQLPLEHKRNLADHVIDNSHALAQTHLQVQQLWQRLLAH